MRSRISSAVTAAISRCRVSAAPPPRAYTISRPPSTSSPETSALPSPSPSLTPSAVTPGISGCRSLSWPSISRPFSSAFTPSRSPLFLSHSCRFPNPMVTIVGRRCLSSASPPTSIPPPPPARSTQTTYTPTYESIDQYTGRSPLVMAVPNSKSIFPGAAKLSSRWFWRDEGQVFAYSIVKSLKDLHKTKRCLVKLTKAVFHVNQKGWVEIKPGAQLTELTPAGEAGDLTGLHNLLTSLLPPTGELTEDMSNFLSQIINPRASALPLEWHTTLIPIGRWFEAIMRIHDNMIVVYPFSSTSLLVASKVSFNEGWQRKFWVNRVLLEFMLRGVFRDNARGLIIYLRVISCHRMDLIRWRQFYYAKDIFMIIKDVCPMLLQEFFEAYAKAGRLWSLQIKDLYP